MKKILIVVAHPDDEVLGMGGSIAKFTSEGKEVHLLIVTDGSSSQYRESSELDRILEEKKDETRRAAEALGIKSVRYGGLPDMKLDVTPHIKINRVIEKAIDEIAPDTVFTHFWGDVNLDHRCVYNSVMVAARPVVDQCVRSVLCFNVPSSTEWNPYIPKDAFLPNVFIDIDCFKEKKYSAMSKYVTELRNYPHPRSIKYLEADDLATGLRCGVPAAEAFILLRGIYD